MKKLAAIPEPKKKAPKARNAAQEPAQGTANTLVVSRRPEQSEAAAFASAALRPTVQAAMTISAAAKPIFTSLRLDELVSELSDQVKAVVGGDLKRMEAMLTAQSHTLDQLFNCLTRHAIRNVGQYRDSVDLYLRLALRAQSQCRANVEALQEMKYPKPVAFVQQANIAAGVQQVNNTNVMPSRACETGIKPNELLEQTHGERLDGGTQGATIGGDTSLATLEPVHRAEDSGR